MRAVMVLALAATGCTENAPSSAGGRPLPTPPPLENEPVSVQMRRAEPRLAGLPYRVLLDFETRLDLSFLENDGQGEINGAMAHTGRAALRLAQGARSLEVKLGSVAGEALGGRWALAGAFFHCDAPASVAVSCGSLPPRSVRLVPGRWTPVMVDLTALASDAAPPSILRFSIDGAQTLFCDDVVLIDNQRAIASAPQSSAEGVWAVRQHGFALSAQRGGRFALTLKSIDERPDGWAIVEANKLRARFTSGGGQEMTLYADGRQYTDGSLAILGPRPAYAESLAEQHANPAEIEVADESGRVDRDTPGDRNNDGYNERRAAYQVVARGPRVEVTLKPRSAALYLPVLEVAGLKGDDVLVTVAGRLIERTARLDDGRLLIELPLVLRGPATISIAARQSP